MTTDWVEILLIAIIDLPFDGTESCHRQGRKQPRGEATKDRGRFPTRSICSRPYKPTTKSVEDIHFLSCPSYDELSLLRGPLLPPASAFTEQGRNQYLVNRFTVGQIKGKYAHFKGCVYHKTDPAR